MLHDKCGLSLSLVGFLYQEQLNQLKAQTQQELQNNMASYTALRSGLARYKVSLAVVDDIGQKGDAKQKMLVPLTQSLYVAGHSINSSKLLVDIGTVRGSSGGAVFKLRKQQQFCAKR